MELTVFLLLIACFLFFFKAVGLMLKATLFVLSIPLQIAGAILGAVILVTLLPFAIVAGVVTAIFAPLLILGPMLPFLLVACGLYLIAKR